MASFDSDKFWESHPFLHTILDWATYKILFDEFYFRHWPPNNGNHCPENP